MFNNQLATFNLSTTKLLSLSEPSLTSNLSLDAQALSSSTNTVTDTNLGVMEVIDAPVDDIDLVDLFDLNLPILDDGTTSPTEVPNSFSDNPIEYGDPFTDANYWREQQGENSCAVVAQIALYESLTGEYISEDAACDYAQQQGWFDPSSGTLLDNTGKILDALGIETYQQYNASFSSLESALAVGDKPIVALDANEIWTPQYGIDGSPLEQTYAGHAVWVTGIDYQPDGSIGIVMNDSGISSGRGSIIDYNDFMNAWQDSNYFVTIADNPLI